MMLDQTKIGEILMPGTEAEQEEQASRVKASFFTTLKRAVRYVPFAEDLVAAYYCAMDSKTPMASRGIMLAALAYFVLPFDIVPDFIFGVGFADDIAVLLAAFRAVNQNITPEHYAQARETLGGLREEA